MSNISRPFAKTLLAASLLLPLLSGASCTKGISPEVAKKRQPVTLEYWRVYDGPDDFQEIINGYKRLRPNITINYRKLRYDEYERALLEAFATDRGPDVFSIQSTWLHGYQGRGLLLPMPGSVKMAYPQIVGSLKKEVVWSLKTVVMPTPNKLREDFIDTVGKDVLISVTDEKSKQAAEKIFGLPLAVETLAMFYNKDLLNNAGITSPSAYWNRKFQEDVKKLTKQNNKGEIIQAGAGLGGGANIERSTDILSVLMMQNGAEMERGRSVSFHRTPEIFAERKYNPGLDALRFYTDFGNPGKEVYTWNKTLEDSLSLFTQNKLAMMFGYSYMLPDIKAKAPKLNLGVAKLPQIEGNPQSINFANYWVEVAAKKTKYPEEAWDFINYMARDKNTVKSYLDKTGKPPALKELIDVLKQNEEIAPFVDQVLTAKSWYHGNDANAAEAHMQEMIAEVTDTQKDIEDIINSGAKKVQQTYD